MSLPASLPASLRALRLPLIAAPMFLVSGPNLVIACCKAGIVGSFPALNARPATAYEQWLDQIEAALADHPTAAPYAVNQIVHKTNTRLAEDMAITCARRVPLVITSVGHPGDIVAQVHGYGGLVFHDVTSLRHAEKAMEAGVDGLILVCAGAGGHAGLMNPFTLVPQVRARFNGTLLLAGAISDGRALLAAQALGADMGYMGTRFIATEESSADPGYKQALIAAQSSDIVYTNKVSGIAGNFLQPSVSAAGIVLDGGDAPLPSLAPSDKKAWKDVWSAGQGVGQIADCPPVSALVDRLCLEYETARRSL